MEKAQYNGVSLNLNQKVVYKYNIKQTLVTLPFVIKRKNNIYSLSYTSLITICILNFEKRKVSILLFFNIKFKQIYTRFLLSFKSRKLTYFKDGVKTIFWKDTERLSI